MNSQLQVHLSKIKMYAYHGTHAEEQVLGSEYEVDLTASYSPKKLEFTLADTVDYTLLLAIVKQRMQQPTPLLETVATEISSEIFAKFEMVDDLIISIFKLQAPIQNFEGRVGVTFKTKRG